MLKIDRSFVAAPAATDGNGNSDAVVRAILALARALGMEAIAEGIETEAQRDTLLAMGCLFGQGYLFGRPAPIAQWQDARAEQDAGALHERFAAADPLTPVVLCDQKAEAAPLRKRLRITTRLLRAAKICVR